MSASRRPHTKSHNGCAKCKARRVKVSLNFLRSLICGATFWKIDLAHDKQCDFQKPSCSNCSRRREQCSFQLSASPRSPVDSSGVINQSSELNVEDLELMHHFSTVVCLTLSENKQILHVWQCVVPKQALRHLYLMHCVLGLSALHLIHTSPQDSEVYRRAAIRHQDIAVATFRPLLVNITAENCDALWASSALTVMFGAAQYQVLPETPGVAKLSPLDGILEVCELVRGVYVVSQAAGEWITDGPLKPVLGDPWEGRGAPELASDIVDALQAVEACIIASSTESTSLVYLSSLQVLQQTFAVMVSTDQPTLVLVWLVLFERQFVVMLRERDPIALVMLAHYGVVLHGARHYWWGGSWGFSIVENVYQVLNSEWRPLIAWPAQKVGFHMPV
jgi:hypothetical protein